MKRETHACAGSEGDVGIISESGTTGMAGSGEGKIERARLPRGLWLCALIITLVLLLAACDSQAGGASGPPSSAAPTSTSALAGGPGPTAAASPSAQATTTGATGQVGFNSVCSQPAGVTAQLPASIPAYPGARLQISQAQGGNALYGLCSSDGRAARRRRVYHHPDERVVAGCDGAKVKPSPPAPRAAPASGPRQADPARRARPPPAFAGWRAAPTSRRRRRRRSPLV